MADRIKILEEDITELKQLTMQAESPRIQEHLADLLSKYKTELEKLQAAINSSQPPPKQSVPVASNDPIGDALKYLPLTKYAWDQEGTKVKVFFSLDGVGKECSSEQVSVVFDKQSVELRLKGYRGQNHIFSIKRLFAQIVPAESKFLLKNNTLTLVIVKKENKSWSQLAFKEEKIGGKAEKKEEVKEDPQAGIMNMMKKMYEEGDENMKRTIAEAWTKANDKKSQGEEPDFKDRYDFLNKK